MLNIIETKEKKQTGQHSFHDASDLTVQKQQQQQQQKRERDT